MGCGAAVLATSRFFKHSGARLYGSELLCILVLVLLSSCAGPPPRTQEVQPETPRGPLVVTTMGVTEFLARELLRGISETRLLGPQVPRERRAEPTPDELVIISRAVLLVAYGNEADRNSVEMVRRVDPNLPVSFVREGGAASGFVWLDPATLRDDARQLHSLLAQHAGTMGNRSMLDANLAALDQRLAAFQQTLEGHAETFAGQRVFTDDKRIHAFLESLGIGIVGTLELGDNDSVDEQQRERIAALAADLPVRIMVVTHPEMRDRLTELAREADLTLVYFNPFFDGAPGVGQMDTVIPRQLSVLRLAQRSALASNRSE